MGTQYSHLALEERAVIDVFRAQGASYAAIARHLGRHRSTIQRECGRGWWLAFDRYAAEFGQRYYSQARVRAGRQRRKLGEELDSPAWRRVLTGLRADWSPEQIAGRLRALDPLRGPLLQSSSYVSHETIYRAIYDQPRSPTRTALVRMLRQSRAGRRRRSRGKRRYSGLPNATPIALRPSEVDDRLVPGHWEGDLLEGARGQSAIGTLVERTSRLTLLVKLDGADSASVRRAFTQRLRRLHLCMRKSLTYDRGTEMAQHEQLTRALHLPVFFCDPYCPWQRGTNENTNGLIRQYLPKGTDLSKLTPAQLAFIESRLNNRPRRVLHFKTPQEVFDEIYAKELVAHRRRA
jgi:transposase, IS30 family